MIRMRVGIWGSSGFLGIELIKIISRRQEIDIVHTATSQKVTGLIEDVQVAFLALPVRQSMELVPKLLEREIKVIDLSGAYRLKNVADYKKYYHLDHLYPELLQKAVYGFPEKNRGIIRNAKLIANPGCYALALGAGLLPLSDSGLISSPTKIVAIATSGYTGAGKGIKIPKTITPYMGGRQHRHVPEVEQELNLQEQLLFFPHIAPWPRGIEVVICAKMSVTTDILDLYKQFYQQELFVRVKSEKTKVDDVVGTNFCDIYPKTKNFLAVIKVWIDNLGKGGAGQAVQNFNILCGFPEELVY